MAALVGVDEESRMPGLQKLVAVAHKHGAKIMVQLVHAGAKRFYDSGFPLEGPSAVKDRTTQIEPVAMTLEDINKTVNDFASAAKLAKKADSMLSRYMEPTNTCFPPSFRLTPTNAVIITAVL